MRIFLATLSLLLLVSVAGAQQVLRPGQLKVEYHLDLSGGQPILDGSFRNTGSTPVTFSVPAGVKFVGKVEPCLPLYTASPVTLEIAPNSQRVYSFGVLSLYDFPHHSGPYTMAHPNPDSVKTGRLIQKAWKNREKLGRDYKRATQLLVYLSEGMEPAKARTLFTEKEFRAAEAAVK